jgi:hypothetical protein
VSSLLMWQAVITFAGLAVACGLVGAVIGRLTARRNAPELHIPRGERPAKQRQAVAYLDVAIAWHSYLRAVRTLLYPEEGPPAPASRDLASVLEARAQLREIGSPVVQDLHDQVLESAVTLIELLRSQSMSPLLDRADLSAHRTSLPLALTAISDRVGALERQMIHEVRYLPIPWEEGEIEMTGRPVPARVAPLPPPLR